MMMIKGGTMKRIFLILLVLTSVFTILHSSEYITDIWNNTTEINFSIKDKNVYFGRQKIDRLDYSDFKKINEHYLKDKNGIYYFFVNHIILEIEDYKEIEYRNIFESSVQDDDQIYEVEGETIKIDNADSNNYKSKGQYLFSNNYVFNQGQILSYNKNKYFTIDQDTLIILYQRCQSLLRAFTCDIIIKDKNKLYILLDGDGNEDALDEYGYSTGEKIKKTKVYEIKNPDISVFEKIETMYLNNDSKIFTDLLKKAKKVI